MENLSALAGQVRTELSKVIIGQREVIDQLLVVLVCGGHAVIEGVPGLAKTLAVKSLARILGLGFQRVQCTADLMPTDITGTNVFNLGTSTFNLIRGPVFTDLLLVDEINRTSPRTQAALLEAMEERQVTIQGEKVPALPELHGSGHPKPHRIRGHVSAAGGAARSISTQDPNPVSIRRGRDRDHRALRQRVCRGQVG